MKYYRPQKLETTIKRVVDKNYSSTDGMYVVLEKVTYDYENEIIFVDARFGRHENADGFHTFDKHISFTLSGKENLNYIEGLVDGMLQQMDLEIGNN